MSMIRHRIGQPGNSGKEARRIGAVIVRLTAPLIFVFSLNCTGFAFKTFYRNLDTLVESRVHSYVALTDEQEDFIDGRIATHYRWHRYTELPNYAAVFQEFATRIDRGLKRDDLNYAYSKMKLFRTRVAYRVYPDALELLRNFSSAQVDKQEKLIQEYNVDLAETVALSPAERFEKRLKSNREFFEFFLGDLSATQNQRISSYTQQSEDNVSQYLAYRRIVQTRLLSLLRRGPEGHDDLQSFLKTYFFQWESLYPPAYRRSQAKNRELFFQTLLDIDGTLTAEQRKHASGRIRELATNFLELAGKK
ncbi:MAG: hypothetical protein KDK37_11975 [Leptospiraceae bacterium]|nr:hypothetical protein [Leptospiraceae bacterium]MCB1304993.1 hypothetical protein [Leptospiraceae bacterium]